MKNQKPASVNRCGLFSFMGALHTTDPKNPKSASNNLHSAHASHRADIEPVLQSSHLKRPHPPPQASHQQVPLRQAACKPGPHLSGSAKPHHSSPTCLESPPYRAPAAAHKAPQRTAPPP